MNYRARDLQLALNVLNFGYNRENLFCLVYVKPRTPLPENCNNIIDKQIDLDCVHVWHISKHRYYHVTLDIIFKDDYEACITLYV